MASELYTRMTKHVAHLMRSSPPIKRHSAQPLPDPKAAHLFLDALTRRFEVLQMHPLYEQDLGPLDKQDLPHWLHAHASLPMEQVWAGLLRRGDNWIALIDAFQQLYCTREGVSTMDLFDQAFLSARVDKCLLELMAPRSMWLVQKQPPSPQQQQKEQQQQSSHKVHPHTSNNYYPVPPRKPKKQKPVVPALGLTLPRTTTPRQSDGHDGHGDRDDDNDNIPAAESPAFVYHTPVRPRLAPHAPLRRYTTAHMGGGGVADTQEDLVPLNDLNAYQTMVDHTTGGETRAISPSWSISSVSTTTSQQEERVHRLQQTFSDRMDRAWINHRRAPLTPPMSASALITALTASASASALQVNSFPTPASLGSVTDASPHAVVTMQQQQQPVEEEKAAATEPVEAATAELVTEPTVAQVETDDLGSAATPQGDDDAQPAQDAQQEPIDVCRARTKKGRRCRGTPLCGGLCADHYHSLLQTGHMRWKSL
jgi:hypothetical protein